MAARDGLAKDGAYKAGWLLQICANGEILGLVDGLSGPAGVQLGSTNARLRERRGDRELRAAARQRRPREDALVLRRARHVPHARGRSGDPRARRAELASARWLKRDTTVDTGPRFEWIDDGGVWRSAADYPRAPAGSVNASGSGTLALLPSLSVTLGSVVLGTPALSTLEIRYASPQEERNIVGEPSLTLTYRGTALPASTYLYAQVFDAQARRVVGGQVTPIPVVLDGRPHTITRKLEAIAVRARPVSDLRLQLHPNTTLYGPQRSAGSVKVSALSSSLPLGAATRSPTPAH